MRPSRVILSTAAAGLAGAALGALLGPAAGPVERLLALCLAGVTTVTPGTAASAWSLAPATLLPVLVLPALYLSAIVSRRHESAPPAWRVVLFGTGWLLLVVAVVSPLCRLAAHLAWAHMVQHVILVALAPPLLLLGTEDVWRRAAAVRGGRVAIRSWLGRPIGAGLAYGAAIWFWHVPSAYEAALRDGALHLVMLGTLLCVALMFWRSLLAAARSDAGVALAAAPVLLATLMHTGMLGALLTFSPGLWFPLMAQGALAFGLSPLADQQLAGLIMWVPMGLVYMAAALGLVARGLAGPEDSAAIAFRTAAGPPDGPAEPAA
ncbi:cytochrome c oxidase assembly protein [Rhodoplanes sp. SY1]|uniref:cytochrome c oxidase assembly protein n=1 Tax=Rhodoplanes sp. SY1 TaxID=3166646 RepID=UPI0038B59194